MITFRSRARGIGAAMVWAVMIFNTISYAQDMSESRIGVRRGREISFEPTGPGVLFGALDPAVKKWYVPQELFLEYQWKQWEYTNYARDRYQRYVDITLEGDYYYDLYGSYITRGWLIYDWTQTLPQQSGSRIFKTERYRTFFSNLLVATDQMGQYHLAVTIGDDIRTTLTPMTFSKPGFSGIQMDFQSDKHEATALLSRPSSPAGSGTSASEHTSQTVLTAGRVATQLGDFVKIGATYVNAHNSTTLLESFEGSPRSGSLSTGQNATSITQLFIRLLDDSPEDEEGGAALFSWDMIIEADVEIIEEDEEGNRTIKIGREVVRASEVGLIPSPQGGFQRRGFWEASGVERIDLLFDFREASYTGPDPSEIKKVTFEIVVANDYRIEVSSDRQLDRNLNIVYLLAARADGNVKDSSNLKLLRIDYGLPTATEIYGVTLEANDILGFDIYGEYDRSRSYRKYPNRVAEQHKTASDEADAWMVNISKIDYPWFLLGEAYSMDDNYNTSAFITARGENDIFYNDIQSFTYEFVDDNDDQDRNPDWSRIFQGSDTKVFPGFDENQDFISDFNQNDSRDRPNAVPDYDEPFLRYGTDRPEFLFGIDMNNNLWVDRFENDDAADFPYDRDHRGFNAYVGLHVTPEVRLMIGQNREELLSGDRDNVNSYVLFTLDKDFPALGRLKIFENFKLAKDNIIDNLRQWNERARRNVPTIDPLAAQDTWINSAYVSFDYTKKRNLNFISKIKFDVWNQRAERPDLRDEFTFFGLINKVDYTFKVGVFDIQPRIKNELRLEAPALRSDPRRRENTLILFTIATLPVLSHSEFQGGVEYTIFRQMRPTDTALGGGLLDDFKESVLAVQFSNVVDYLGYKLISQFGLRWSRKKFAGEEDAQTGSVAFATVYAGVQE